MRGRGVSAVTLALTVIGVVAGLALGAVGGYRAGLQAQGVATRYWTLNGLAFVSALGLDIAGMFVHRAWLSYGSLGLMAGLITGLKYGYSPDLRMWETRAAPPTSPDEDEAEDATGEEVGDAEGPIG